MDDNVMEIVKTYSLQRLLANMQNDLEEDGDTGINLNMTIEEYLKLLISYSD